MDESVHTPEARSLWARMQPYVEDNRVVEEPEMESWLSLLPKAIDGGVKGSLKAKLMEGFFWAIFHGKNEEVAMEMWEFALQRVTITKDRAVWRAIVRAVSEMTEEGFDFHHSSLAKALLDTMVDAGPNRLDARLEHLGACCAHLYTLLRTTGYKRPYGWQFKEWDFQTEGQAVLLSPRVLGEGTFGRVFLAFIPDFLPERQFTCTPGKPVFTVPRIPVAVKVLRETHQMEDTVLEECQQLEANASHCVVRIMRTVREHEVHPRHLVMEFMDYTLEQRISELHGTDGINEDSLRSLAKLLAVAVNKMHVIFTSHRDIKPQNIGILSNLSCTEHCSCQHPCHPCPLRCKAPKRSNLCLKLFDLGWATDANELRGTVAGTPYYMAPELLCGYTRAVAYSSTKSDVWSVALVILFMALGERPVPECKQPMDLLQHLLGANSHVEACRMADEDLPADKSWPSFPRQEWFSDDLIDLLRGMLRLNPSHRLSMDEVCEHPWFTQHEPCDGSVVEGDSDEALVDEVVAAHDLFMASQHKVATLEAQLRALSKEIADRDHKLEGQERELAALKVSNASLKKERDELAASVAEREGPVVAQQQELKESQ